MKKLLLLPLLVACQTSPSAEETAGDHELQAEVRVVRLAHASAVDMAAELQKFVGDPGGIRVVADERSNSVLVSAAEDDMEPVMNLIATLDLPPDSTR